MSKFLDYTGLSQLVELMKETFALINHTHPNATSDTDGLMSASDKSKLDNLSLLKTQDISEEIWGDKSTDYEDIL